MPGVAVPEQCASEMMEAHLRLVVRAEACQAGTRASLKGVAGCTELSELLKI